MRPFQLTPHQSATSLIWNGQDFHRVRCQSRNQTLLTVSHRSMHQGKGWILLRGIEAADRNAKIAQELTHSAYTCSIPLTLDGRRLDALQACPSHGFSKVNYPIEVGWVNADSPDLPLPPASLGGFNPTRPGDASLSKILHFPKKLAVPQSLLLTL